MPTALLEKPREKDADVASVAQDTTPKVLEIFGKEVDVNNIPTPNIRALLAEFAVQTKGYGDHTDYHRYGDHRDYDDLSHRDYSND